MMPEAVLDIDAEKRQAEQDATDEAMRRFIPSPLRADLILQRQFFKGEEYYVVKDPLALNYFRLQPEEAFLLSLLDGKRDMEEVLKIFNDKHPHTERTIPELMTFVNELGQGGLLNISARRFVSFARGNKKKGINWLLLWGKLISGILFIKIPLIDPSPWIDGLVDTIKFMWNKWVVRSVLCFFVWTIGLLLLNLDAFSHNSINFFAPSNLFLLWISLIFIKTLHEFGHATTCRYFGGEVHEMGLCFMCFTPCGYVDASDAWMMRHKKHKLFVAMAGMYTEFIIACIAAHIWLILPPGLGKNLAFNAMLVSSINTLIFNANPLMKFDGYYIFSDMVEIPNLRAKAIAFCSSRLQLVLLGYRNTKQEEMFRDQQHGRLFAFYAVFAYLYMFYIIYGLSIIFAKVLKPYGLESVGLMMGVFVEGSYAMLPVVKVLYDAFSPGAHIIKVVSPWRQLARVFTVIGIVTLVIVFYPTHYKVSHQGVIVSRVGEHIATDGPGQIIEIPVTTGQWVNPGDVVVRLRNSDLEAEADVSQLDFDLAKLAMGVYSDSKSSDQAGRAATAATGLESAIARNERFQHARAQLILRASVAGYVLTPDLNRMVGGYVPPNTAIVRIGNTKDVKVIIPVTEDEAQLLSIGDPVEGIWEATGEHFTSRLEELPQRKAKPEEYHAGMFAAFGGPVPFEHTTPNEHFDPKYSIYLAEAPVPDPTHAVHEGMRVKVTIIGKKATLGEKLWRYLVSLWNLKSQV